MFATAERYCQLLGATLRLSTAAKYGFAIRAFLRFLDSRYPEVTTFSELRREPHIESWLVFLATKKPPYKPGSREDLIRKIRRFLSDIGEEGWQWQEAPPSGLLTRADMPPREKYLPKPLTPHVDAAIQQGLADHGLLCARALLLARYTGVRIGELMRLRRDCVVELSEECSAIRVPFGKLRSERVIPVDAKTLELIAGFRTECGSAPAWTDPETGKHVRLLICRESGHPPAKCLFGTTLHAVVKSLGIQERVWPHRLRHTCATDLLRRGMSLVAVMKMLGHRSIHMTMNYVQVTQNDLTREFLLAAAKTQEKYPTSCHPANLGATSATAISVFDDLVASIQDLRFDHSTPQQRAKLARLVERIRRARSDFEQIVS